MTVARTLLHPTVVLVAVSVAVLAAAGTARAGGIVFDDDNANVDEGPSYFGFVRDANGSAVPNAKVTASRDNAAFVTHSNVMGVYKLAGFGKNIDPNSIVISCAKDGYKQTDVVRRSAGGDSKDPVEVDCTLQKE